MEGDDAISANSRLGRALKVQATQLRVAGAAGDDRDVIREALNTVGRPGGLGEQIRCVVSVSMLTEGWDTRTVVHILGFRAFGTQLLCEQVTGRALRRSNYDSFDGDGRLTPEFADVLGVPFDFMPVTGSSDPPPPKARYRVFALPGRPHRRIEFPALTGYMIEPASPGVDLDPSRVGEHTVSGAAPSMTETAGVAGESEVIATADDATAPAPTGRGGTGRRGHSTTRRQPGARVRSLGAETTAPPATVSRTPCLPCACGSIIRTVRCDDISWLLRPDQSGCRGAGHHRGMPASALTTTGSSAPSTRRRCSRPRAWISRPASPSATPSAP